MGSPLVIGIDFRPALSRATGVGRYFHGLVAGLQAIDHDNDYVLFSSSFKERPRLEARPPNFRLVDRRVPVRLLNALWHRVGSPKLDRLVGRPIDVAHSPTPLVLPSRRGRSIVTICDLFFVDHPEATRAEIRRDYATLVRRHVHRADAVVAISETTADDAAEKLDLPREAITVIHAGLDERFREVASPNRASAPYLLAVATEEPRKNLPLLLDAVAVLKKRGWEGRLKIAGGPGLESDRISERVSVLGLEGAVERLGYVAADALPSLYRHARAVVMPSRWEGFGLPLLEAMASATPVVASDIPVHREVAGEAALYVPAEARAVADGIESAWCDEALRQRLVDAGLLRIERFSWEASARKALELYRRIARA